LSTTRNSKYIDNKLGLIQVIQHQERLNTIPQKKKEKRKKKKQVIEIPQKFHSYVAWVQSHIHLF
jgi:hypothetical protein